MSALKGDHVIAKADAPFPPPGFHGHFTVLIEVGPTCEIVHLFAAFLVANALKTTIKDILFYGNSTQIFAGCTSRLLRHDKRSNVPPLPTQS